LQSPMMVSASALPNFRRKLRRCSHSSILSRNGASGKVGAVHGAGRASVWWRPPFQTWTKVNGW
jgi:hypothetical protein